MENQRSVKLAFIWKYFIIILEWNRNAEDDVENKRSVKLAFMARLQKKLAIGATECFIFPLRTLLSPQTDHYNEISVHRGDMAVLMLFSYIWNLAERRPDLC